MLEAARGPMSVLVSAALEVRRQMRADRSTADELAELFLDPHFIQCVDDLRRAAGDLERLADAQGG